MDEQKNYISGAFKVAAGVILILIALSFIPKFEVGGINIKRADILSDLRPPAKVIPQEAAEDSSVQEQTQKPDSTISDSTFRPPADSSATPNKDTLAAALAAISVPDGIVAIEDFGQEAEAMEHFYAALNSANSRPVKIAVLGDSFIEGDILTADLREQLQEIFGGCGIGFVPFSSNLPPIRATANLRYEKWTSMSVMSRSVPEEAKGRFFVSGVLSRPQEKALSRVEATSYRKHLRGVPQAKLLFVNEGSTIIDITVNDSIHEQFAPPSSAEMQQITLRGRINSVEARFSQTEGFWGYGMTMYADNGIVVDNYSIRGNAGHALYKAGKSIIGQISAFTGGYDLVILQYGLNVLTPGQLGYDNYAATLTSIVGHVKSCFPGSSIMIMSVGDRSSRASGDFGTMPEVDGMIRAQRAAATKCQTAFWNTFLGMGGRNSMVRYVENNWAAKDHTHIGYAGGRQIARRMVEALISGKDVHDRKKAVIKEATHKAAEKVYKPNTTAAIGDTAR